MAIYTEKINYGTDENGTTTTRYNIDKSPIAFDELKKLPKAVLAHYYNRGDLVENYILCRIDNDRKNVFVGRRHIGLKKLGANYAVKGEWVSKFSIINGKFRGENYRDSVMFTILAEELGAQNISEPIIDLPTGASVQTYEKVQPELINKTVIKKLVAGKIRTREDLLIESFKSKYGITTASPETIEKWFQMSIYDGNINGISTIKAAVAPEHLDYAIKKACRISKTQHEYRAFNMVTKYAREVGCTIDPHGNLPQMLETARKLIGRYYDILVEYNAFRNCIIKYNHPAYLKNMEPITSTAQGYKICTSMNLTNAIIDCNQPLDSPETMTFHYRDDKNEGILIMTRNNSENGLKFNYTYYKNNFIETSGKDIHEIIEKQIKKNSKQLIEMLQSKTAIVPTCSTPEAETEENLDYPF